jgi:rSAM/selenodomain-associated transferase 2
VNLLVGKKWLSWTRLPALIATASLLILVFRQIDLAAVIHSMKQMRVVSFLTAFLAYGLALTAGAYRWHLALRCTERVVHLLASWRLALAGHFFLTTFFGAISGDAAKSLIYARWFRFRLPEVLAAAPLDRAWSLGGALLLTGATLVISAARGGFARLQQLNVQKPGVWTLAVICLVAITVLALFFRKSKVESSWAGTIRALGAAGWRILISPRIAGPGLLAALLAQAMLSAVFACNLDAVSPAPIPWTHVAWTFPVITALSCLPLTVAGAGAREVASMTLLGLYGVPAEHCVAASMMTLLVSVTWAAMGADVLRREQALLARQERPALPQSVSVVIPTLNEAHSLPETVARAQANLEVCEIIVVDGGSRDGTGEIAEQLGCRVLSSPPGRGGQMRRGAAEARGDVVMLLHADTWLPPNATRAALHCLRDDTVVAGGFWKVFQQTPPLLLGSRLKCAIRVLLCGRILGDQAMFIRRDILEKSGGIPAVVLMEEFELCRRLQRMGRLVLADATVVTSARRFQKLGVLRTYLRMGWITIRYWLGASPHELKRLYEKD